MASPRKRHRLEGEGRQVTAVTDVSDEQEGEVKKRKEHTTASESVDSIINSCSSESSSVTGMALVDVCAIELEDRCRSGR